MTHRLRLDILNQALRKLLKALLVYGFKEATRLFYFEVLLAKPLTMRLFYA